MIEMSDAFYNSKKYYNNGCTETGRHSITGNMDSKGELTPVNIVGLVHPHTVDTIASAATITLELSKHKCHVKERLILTQHAIMR